MPFPPFLADVAPPPHHLPAVPGLAVRRLWLMVPSAALALLLVGLSVAVLAKEPHGVLDWLLLGPFALVMSWECFVVWQMVLGFVSALRGVAGRTALERRAVTVEPVATGRSRTAVAIPIFEEEPAGVFARLDVMLASLAGTGGVADVAFHVLSDTRSVAVAAAEEREWAAFQARHPQAPVHYRRRPVNAGRKAGNIADFLDAEGRVFDFAIVLDADSLMSGAAMRRLIRLMEENPRVGLIQTVSYATGRDTLFARIQQFAVRLYAPLPLRGLDFWQGPEASYWGHNAILRVEPFRLHCRLPVLPGRPPLGGEILCHDVVEAALMVRAGWETRLLPHLEGTWEEMPTNALDLMSRERRWCAGNLQHLRVMLFPGLRGASRGHIALGIGGYVTAVAWWAFLGLGAVRALAAPGGTGLGLLAFGATEQGLAATALLALSAALVIVPRLLPIGRALSDPADRAGFGGGLRLLCGAALEQGLWLLLGPVLSVVNAVFVVQVLFGRVVGWNSQSRADRAIPWGEALRRHAPHVMIGAVLGMAALQAGGWYALWMAPTVCGLTLSPLLTIGSASRRLGRWSRRGGLFLTVDDVDPAPELLALRAAEA